MGTLSDKSDGEYSYIEDKGDIGFIDIANCKSVCSYNPSEESQIVRISVPFPLVDGKPQSGIVGETKFHSITIKNITDEPLELWSVSIYDSKPEGSFTLSILKPPTADADEEYLLDFIESFTLEDRVLRVNQELTIWLSCKPAEIGLHSAAVHFNVGDEFIERLVFVLAENKISRSLASERPYQRLRRQRQDVANVHSENTAYVVGRRPGNGSNRSYKSRLDEYPIPIDIRGMVNSRQIPGPINEGLTETNYGAFFKTLLAMEEIKLEDDMSAYDMVAVTLRGRRNQFLSLEVPGLAERRPSLVCGDHIFVRLATDDETAANVRYQGYIHRVEAEEIYLKFNPKFHKQHREGNQYNIQFAYNRTGMRRLYQAVETAESLDKNFLFPSPLTEMRMGKPSPLVPKLLTLNEEQKECVETILACRGGCPYIIHGPPGTGKTMTLIEAMLQIYATKRNARMLVCAPSNSAADHILERLIDQTTVEIKKNEIFRLNAFTRPFEDVSPNLIDFCCMEDDLFKCPPRWDLLQCRIIISTYTSASHIYGEGIKRGHFSHFFLDEAGQASEPESMIPLSHLYSTKAVVVLAGDPMQLGPVIFSKDAESHGLGTSYLERLCGCKVYLTRSKNFMTKLVRNYRTHKAILQLPSDLFYEGELIPCKEESTGSASLPWKDLIPNKSFPLLFIGIQGCDEREGSNPSWFNRIEASKVVEIVGNLIENGMKEENIGVITPYRQQVSKIRGALDGLEMADIKVGSVEQFQGQEKEVIVISTVRSTVKHHEFDRLHYLGFLSNPRRFNVAITRAKALLVVIGNPHILCKDPNWNNLLWYCVDNDSYKGCFLPEREFLGTEVPSWTGEGKWGDQGSKYETSETQWDQGGDNWKASEGNWDNNWEPSQDNWDEVAYNQKPPDAPWSLDVERPDNWKPSDIPWVLDDEVVDNQNTSKVPSSLDVERPDDWKPSEVPSSLDVDRPDDWKPSDIPWIIDDEPSNPSTVVTQVEPFIPSHVPEPFIPSDVPWNVE